MHLRQVCYCLALSSLLLASQTFATDTRNYLLATASTGGTYYPVGVAIATLAKIRLGQSEGIRLSAINSAGSAENVKLMANNEVQFAILQGLYGHFLWQGSGPMKPLGPQRDLRAITNLWKNVEHFVIRSEHLDSGTLSDLMALKGEYMALGKRNSGAIESNRWLFGNLGTNIDTRYRLVYSGYSASANALQNGRIAGFSAPAGAPSSTISRVLASAGDKVRLLNVTPKQATEADGGINLWVPFTIAADTYPNQNKPIKTIAQHNFLAVRADVDQDAVYQITKTLFENLSFLRSIHGAMKEVDLDSAIQGLSIPLHAGAYRYFREVGLEVPSHLVPKEVLTSNGKRPAHAK